MSFLVYLTSRKVTSLGLNLTSCEIIFCVLCLVSKIPKTLGKKPGFKPIWKQLYEPSIITLNKHLGIESLEFN